MGSCKILKYITTWTFRSSFKAVVQRLKSHCYNIMITCNTYLFCYRLLVQLFLSLINCAHSLMCPFICKNMRRSWRFVYAWEQLAFITVSKSNLKDIPLGEAISLQENLSLYMKPSHMNNLQRPYPTSNNAYGNIFWVIISWR